MTAEQVESLRGRVAGQQTSGQQTSEQHNATLHGKLLLRRNPGELAKSVCRVGNTPMASGTTGEWSTEQAEMSQRFWHDL